MRISWFRPDPPAGDVLLDAMGSLVAALAARHDIRVITRASAYDEVWRWHRKLTDLAIYEVTDTAGDAYLWPYMVRFPGLALVLGRHPGSAHSADLVRRSRGEDADAERAFVREAPGGALAIPLHSSRAVAVLAGSALATPEPPDHGQLLGFEPAMARPTVSRIGRSGPLRIGMHRADARARAVADRAVGRARETGARLECVASDSAADVLGNADVVLSFQWPPQGGCDGIRLAAAALGIPAVVLESPDTSTLPCLDPQTWQPRDRGPGAPAPVAVSLDPRDEEHSLMLALRRLAENADLLGALGAAAEARWQHLHEPAAAAAAFAPLLAIAQAAPPPSVPATWPAHFRADGSGTARRILGEFGLQVDVLR